MAKKKDNTMTFLIVGAVILFLLLMRGCPNQVNTNGGNAGGGGSSPNLAPQDKYYCCNALGKQGCSLNNCTIGVKVYPDFFNSLDQCNVQCGSNTVFSPSPTPTPNHVCTDSDGGENFTVQGTCYDTYHNYNMVDSCSTDGKLDENYCVGGVCMDETHVCDKCHYCSTGACLPLRCGLQQNPSSRADCDCSSNSYGSCLYNQGQCQWYPIAPV